MSVNNFCLDLRFLKHTSVLAKMVSADNSSRWCGRAGIVQTSSQSWVSSTVTSDFCLSPGAEDLTLGGLDAVRIKSRGRVSSNIGGNLGVKPVWVFTSSNIGDDLGVKPVWVFATSLVGSLRRQ
jgi:hypothetical protein